MFPDYHKKWLTKRYPSYTNADFDDVAQIVLVRTMETKRVEKYDASKRGRNNTIALFLDYMSHCFGHDLATILSARSTEKRKVEKLSESLEDYTNSHEYSALNGSGVSQNEWLSLRSHNYANRTEQEGYRAYNSARLKQFRSFVAKHRPDLIPVLDAIESGDDLGISRQLYFLRRAALKGLAKHFENGTVPKKSNWSTSEEYQKRLEYRKYYAEHREQIITNRRRRKKRKGRDAK